jgi:hypothetical protein
VSCLRKKLILVFYVCVHCIAIVARRRRRHFPINWNEKNAFSPSLSSHLSRWAAAF